MTLPPKYQPYLELLLPSSIGVLFYMVASLLIVGVQSLNAITNTGIIQVESIWFHHLGQWTTRTIDHLERVLGAQRVDNAIIYIFWGGLGILIWLLIETTSRDMGELVQDLNLREYIWPKRSDRNRPLKQLLKRGLLHLIVFTLLLIYVFHALNFLLHAGHNVAATAHGSSLVLLERYVGLLLEWLVGWHLFTILTRLFFLRTLLGSAD